MKSNGVAYVVVNGKQIRLRFCLWAIRQACRNLGITLEGFFDRFESSNSKAESAMGIFDMLDFYAECFKEAANYELPDDAVPYQTKHAYSWIETLGFSSKELQQTVGVLMESITYQITGAAADTAAATEKTPAKKKR